MVKSRRKRNKNAQIGIFNFIFKTILPRSGGLPHGKKIIKLIWPKLLNIDINQRGNVKIAHHALLFLFLKLLTIFNSIYWLWSYDLKRTGSKVKISTFHFWLGTFRVIAP